MHKNFLLQNKSETLDINEFLGCSLKEGCNTACTWIKLNVNQSGFYRVKYDEGLAAKLRSAIEKKNLSETDRFGTSSIFLPRICFFDGQRETLTTLY